jgi:hypothetical protein
MSDDNNQRIALEFDVFARLVKYGNETLKKAPEPPLLAYPYFPRDANRPVGSRRRRMKRSKDEVDIACPEIAHWGLG